MIRRLIESLLIEGFEKHGLDSKIKRPDGNYLDLADIIGQAQNEKKLSLSKTAKGSLPQLKFFGNIAAHSRTALVRKDDLDRLHNAVRISIEELAHHL